MLTQLKKIGSVSFVSYATYFQDKFSLEEAQRINVGAPNEASIRSGISPHNLLAFWEY